MVSAKHTKARSQTIYNSCIGWSKARYPLPCQNEKWSMKTEDIIFKYDLFDNLLELFGLSVLTNDPFFGEIKKSYFFPNFYPKITTELHKNMHDIKYTIIS